MTRGTSPDEKGTGEGGDGGGAAPGGREPHVPRPPSPEALREISEEQALITDEWGGDEGEAATPGRGPPPGKAG